MILIDGKSLSSKLKIELKESIQNLVKKHNKKPKLVAIIVGDDPASQVYVKSKMKSCLNVGIDSETIKLDSSISQAALIEKIHTLNNDSSVNGILVQLPLPKHIDTQTIINSISIEKDVDGFHPENIGRLQIEDDSRVDPCTPKGVMTMLREYNIDPAGKNVVVVGASNIVGKPMAQMLLNARATVSICHSLTTDLKSFTSKADIIVIAIGHDRFLKADMVKQGAVIVDVGINRVDGKIYGDADFEGLKNKVSAITPVPGGVGPMTITELLFNTVECFKKQNKD